MGKPMILVLHSLQKVVFKLNGQTMKSMIKDMLSKIPGMDLFVSFHQGNYFKFLNSFVEQFIFKNTKNICLYLILF